MEKFESKLELKALDDAGEFEGFLSVFGNRDSQDDVVVKGAFTKTLQDRGGVPLPLLWQHDTKQPIGAMTATETDRGLVVRGRLILEIARAKEAHLLMKAGVIRGMSIGFKVVREKLVDGVRRLLEIQLFEGSIVTLPSNSQALVTAIKSEQDVLDEVLGQVRNWRDEIRNLSA